MRYDTKTVRELETEIAYYRQEAARTTSPDRIRRAHVAISTREKALPAARLREAQAATRR